MFQIMHVHLEKQCQYHMSSARIFKITVASIIQNDLWGTYNVGTLLDLLGYHSTLPNPVVVNTYLLQFQHYAGLVHLP